MMWLRFLFVCFSFLEQFFQIYKEYQQNDFYVTGEVSRYPLNTELLS